MSVESGIRVDRFPCARIVDMPQHTAVATITTNHGPIQVELYGNHAPKTVDKFEPKVRTY